MIVASKKERASYYLFLIPAFVIFGVFIFWPTVQSFYLSLCKYSLSSIKSAEFIGFKNFITLFKNKVFWQAMKNTAIYTLFTVPFLMAAGLFLALLLFVGIPLPGTGAWTGTLAASFLNMGIKSTAAAVSLGVILAAVIMVVGSHTVIGVLA